MIDFYCHELMLAIEIDGNSHLTLEVQENDFIRQGALQKLGINFIRFNDIDVKKNMNDVIRCLQGKIKELKTT